MLDAVSDTGLSADRVSVSQLEAAANFWSPDTFARSSLQPLARRYSFDVPIPAQVVDAQVAQRAGGDGSPETDGVLFAKAVPVISGRAVVLSWYAAMAEALQTGHDERAMKLFEAALSVPIRLRLMPDFESCQLASLSFQESTFNTTAASGAGSFLALRGRGIETQQIRTRNCRQLIVSEVDRYLEVLRLDAQRQSNHRSHAEGFEGADAVRLQRLVLVFDVIG